MVHFRLHTRCFDSSYDALMSPKGYKSFGSSEFDKNMEEQAKVESYEDARLQALNLHRQTAITHCPNVGELPFFLNFEYIILGFEFLASTLLYLRFRV
jgi:hypothetical protein